MAIQDRRAPLRRFCVTLGIAGLCALLTTGCAAHAGALLTPTGRTPGMSGAPSGAGIHMRLVRRDAGASFHVLHVRGESAPRSLGHDLTLFVMSGRLRVHLGEGTYVATPGDAIDIPRGTLHAFESISADPVVLYVVATPALPDGAEGGVAGPPAPRVSAWKWTRWGR